MARKPKDEPTLGDNSVDPEALAAFVARLDTLQEDQDAVNDDVAEVYKEVKGAGFDPKVLRKVMKLRRMDKALREAESEMLEAYCRALGL
jgi:uncharacterized protein (UPF0335 family)